MRPGELPARELVRARVADALAVMGYVPDPFRVFWADTDASTRRMLCQIAKVAPWYADDAWTEIPASVRGQIKQRAAELKSWLNRVLP